MHDEDGGEEEDEWMRQHDQSIDQLRSWCNHWFVVKSEVHDVKHERELQDVSLITAVVKRPVKILYETKQNWRIMNYPLIGETVFQSMTKSNSTSVVYRYDTLRGKASNASIFSWKAEEWEDLIETYKTFIETILLEHNILLLT